MNTSIVKVRASDKKVIEETLLPFNVVPRFYTIENNEDLLQMELDGDSPVAVWYLAWACGYSKGVNDCAQTVIRIKGSNEQPV